MGVVSMSINALQSVVESVLQLSVKVRKPVMESIRARIANQTRMVGTVQLVKFLK